jgi:hypothetical protein
MAGGPCLRRAALLLAAAGAGLALGACEEESPTAPALTVACAATPASGAAPLSVSFTLNVAGASGVAGVSIDYGDGQRGASPAAPHVYEAAGRYSAVFTVTTPTQSALCSALVEVSAPQPTPPPAAENRPPLFVYDVDPDPNYPGGWFTTSSPLQVRFNLCRSSDPDGDRLLFRMDLDGDGVYEVEGPTGAECRRTRDFGYGVYRPKVCVTDMTSSLAPAHPYQCKDWTLEVRRN